MNRDHPDATVQDLGHVLTYLRIVTPEQWEAAADGTNDAAAILDRLQAEPAWWDSTQPTFTEYQRRRIDNRLARGLRDLDRDLRVNNYLVLDHLGEGGMAVVYKAWALDFKRTVAIKRLTSNERVFRGRLEREARILRTLNHPHVASYLAFEPVDDGEGFLLVMEHIPGVTLREYINREQTVPVALAVAWTVEILDALEHAHQCGVIHRDITPRNIMLIPDARGGLTSKLLDFGLGKHSGSQVELTGADQAMGTPQYMSPEQFRDAKNVTSQSDLYSLGCNLYLMLAGVPPFPDTAFAALCMKHLGTDAPPLSQFRDDVPPSLERAVRMMLAKSPPDRGTIPELIDVLQGRSTAKPQAAAGVRVPPPLPGTPPAAAVRRSPFGIPIQSARPKPMASVAEPAIKDPGDFPKPPDVDRNRPIPQPPPLPKPAAPPAREPLPRKPVDATQGWLTRIIPKSPLAAESRFIDPESSLADFAAWSVRPLRFLGLGMLVAVAIWALVSFLR